MRICSPVDTNPGNYRSREIPLEVNLWLNRGWTIIPSERKGIVLLGKKEMRKRDRVLFWLGCLSLACFFIGFPSGGFAGFLMLTLAGLGYWRNTVPPTKFFPAEGERPRRLER
jgi:hypothetical protein